MFLKSHLKEVFKKAALENNFFLKEKILLKWVHRFGIESLNDLLIYSSALKENQEQISLIGEENEKENQEQISLIGEENEKENQEQIKYESTELQTSLSNEIIIKYKDSNKIKQYTKIQKSPLPYIKNLRKWINNDKKAS